MHKCLMNDITLYVLDQYRWQKLLFFHADLVCNKSYFIEMRDIQCLTYFINYYTSRSDKTKMFMTKQSSWLKLKFSTTAKKVKVLMHNIWPRPTKKFNVKKYWFINSQNEYFQVMIRIIYRSGERLLSNFKLLCS